jgi:cysteine-rich repeat protein
MCGDGTTQSACNEDCDDGNTTPGDDCSATCHVETACSTTPAGGCKLPTASKKAQLQIADKTPDSKDRLQFKWGKGAATTMAEFGSPTTTTGYALCVYDNGNLVTHANIPAGGTCAGRQCWTQKPTGFQYKDKDLTPHGIAQLKLKAGIAGKAQVQVKGSRDNLLTPTLPLTLPVRVQLQNSLGTCWEANFSAPASKNVPALYKDKSD